MGRSQRSVVQHRLNAELPAAGVALVAAVRDTIPAYRALEPGQLQDVQAIASWALSRVVELWVENGSLTDRDRARFRAIGAARAADGRPVAAVLRAYRVAAGTAIDFLVQLGEGALDVNDVAALSRVWLAALDELSEALLTGYTTALDQLTGNRDRALRELLDDLLIGRNSSPGAFADRCHQLAVALPPQPLFLLVEPVDVGMPATDALAADLGLVPSEADPPTPRRHLGTTRGRRAVLLLPPEVLAAVEPAVAARGWRGCLVAGRPVAGTAAAYRLAADTLDTAPAHAYEGRAVLNDGDAHLLALLSARTSADPAEIVRTVLGPLADPANRHLLDGLAAFLATGSATAAAEQLHVHPQTLRYRLRRVRELTGRDPRLPWQRLALDVARHLAEISPQHRS